MILVDGLRCCTALTHTYLPKAKRMFHYTYTYTYVCEYIHIYMHMMSRIRSICLQHVRVT